MPLIASWIMDHEGMPGRGIPAPDPGCWLHPAVEVRESPIGGRGLFLTKRVERGVGPCLGSAADS